MTGTLSPARIRLALLALALGGFAIGCTEFAAMGLLPNIAESLLPQLYATSHESANAQAGWLVTAYALGVVAGAPTIAAFGARLPRKRLLLILLVAVTLSTVASALAPTFGLVFVARFISGLPHGAYFGIAALVAASLMGPGKRAKGVAFVLSGLTIANVVGVPFVTWLGENSGWRVAYLVISAIFALTFIAVAFLVPWQEGNPESTMRSELKAFGRLQVWLTLGIAAIGMGGLFAVYAYVSPLATNVAGINVSLVPFVLVIMGIGMTAGNILGGIAADRNLKRYMLVAFMMLLASLIGLFLFASSVVGLLVFLFLIALSALAIGPSIQTRLMDVAHESQSIAAALNHSAFNTSNALGAFLGGAVIAAGLGYSSPALVGAILAIGGIILAVVSFTVDRHRRRRTDAGHAGVSTPSGSLEVVSSH